MHIEYAIILQSPPKKIKRIPVSYTHLDVYKRQTFYGHREIWSCACSLCYFFYIVSQRFTVTERRSKIPYRLAVLQRWACSLCYCFYIVSQRFAVAERFGPELALYATASISATNVLRSPRDLVLGLLSMVCLLYTSRCV